MHEPGLNRHEWESELEQLDEDLHTDPFDALPQLADLVEEMLEQTGYELEDPVAREGDEREIVAEYLAAREISDLVESGNDQMSPGDVAAAIDGLRSIANYIIAERATSSS